MNRAFAEIDLNALQYNINKIKNNLNSGEIMAVVKADAYGHGASFISTFLEKTQNINNFAVCCLDEAIELRNAGIKGDILIMGGTDLKEASQISRHKLIQTVFSLDYAKELNDSAKSIGKTFPISIKLDTGMSRLGLNCRTKNAVPVAISKIQSIINLSNLNTQSIYTHFSSADNDKEYTTWQFNLFRNAADNFEFKKHCCNSAAALLHKNMHLDYCRVGIAMYGLTPYPSLYPELKPVMTLKATVSQVKVLEKGSFISYSNTYQAKKEMKIAVISAGYADGYRRQLSNKGYVFINGGKAKVLGRVCMDQIIADVTDINVLPGDEATLFGKGLPVEHIADVCDTINYEIVTGVSRRVPRIYTLDGRVIHIQNHLNK